MNGDIVAIFGSPDPATTMVASLTVTVTDCAALELIRSGSGLTESLPELA